MAGKNDLREAKIFSLAEVGDRCIVVIEEINGPRLVPIWIDIFQGRAIAAELTGQEPPRPMTYDLFNNVLTATNTRLDRVIITDLRDYTYFAEIHLKFGESIAVLDSRPSDAMAMAVRAHCPVFVAEAVFEKCPEVLKPISEDEVREFKDELKSMKPEDFFKDLKKEKKDKPPRPNEPSE